MSALVITSIVTVVVAVINTIQTVVMEMIKRKAAPIAREAVANLTVEKLATSVPRMRAVSPEGMINPQSDSGIFWKNRSQSQEETLAAIRRVLASSTYRDPALATLAIRDLLAARPGDSSTQITSPGTVKR